VGSERCARRTQRDLLEREIRHRLLRIRPRLRREVRGSRADELMTAPAITLPRDATVEEAIRLMEDHGVHRPPVLDDDTKLVGFLRSDSGLREEVSEEVIKRAMAILDDSHLPIEEPVHTGFIEALKRHS